jgi:hypothetical protein
MMLEAVQKAYAAWRAIRESKAVVDGVGEDECHM